MIIAIFLVIVLGALGAAAVTLSKTQQVGGTRSLAAARVYYAAKAGLEWGIQQAIAPAAPSCVASTNISGINAMQGALSGIVVTVECTQSTHGAGNFVYYIRSCATTDGTCNAAGSTPGALFAGPNHAERRLEATVSN